MLVAVIGDNHGNALGLAEVVKDLRRRSPDVTVHLGDAFQGGTQPSESAAMLRDLGCQIALGNSDNWLATAQSSEAVGGPAEEVGEWTRQQLGEEGLNMIRGFPLTIQVDTPIGKLLCFHGSPTSFDHVLLPEIEEDEIRGHLEGTDAAILAGGHTHIQWTRTFEGATFVNPGSAGAVYNRYMEMEEFFFYPMSEYALLHIEKDSLRIEFCHIPFDVDEFEKVCLASSRPYAANEPKRYRPPR